MYTPLVARHADTSYSVSVYVVSTLGIRPSLGSMNPIKECLHHFAREDAQKKTGCFLCLASCNMQAITYPSWVSFKDYICYHMVRVSLTDVLDIIIIWNFDFLALHLVVCC